jgi:hypothetical protein
MTMDAETLKNFVDAELQHVSDERVATHIRGLLADPYIELRNWDYGAPGEQFPCWVVLAHRKSNTGIAYCEHGFGPSSPWGLITLNADDPMDMSIGMDSGWFPTFLDAYFESFAPTELPIWRVLKTDASGVRKSLTDEGHWDTTWNRIADLRKEDPASRYDCGHSIAYLSLKWDESERA